MSAPLNGCISRESISYSLSNRQLIAPTLWRSLLLETAMAIPGFPPEQAYMCSLETEVPVVQHYCHVSMEMDFFFIFKARKFTQRSVLNLSSISIHVPSIPTFCLLQSILEDLISNVFILPLHRLYIHNPSATFHYLSSSVSFHFQCMSILHVPI